MQAVPLSRPRCLLRQKADILVDAYFMARYLKTESYV